MPENLEAVLRLRLAVARAQHRAMELRGTAWKVEALFWSERIAIARLALLRGVL